MCTFPSKPTRILPLVCVLISMLTVVALSYTHLYAQLNAVPRAVVRIPEIDFGFLPQKSKVSHTFYLINNGTADLKVDKIKMGCSCTSASEPPDPVAPGDSVPITITFNSGRYRKEVHKVSHILSNDPANANLKLSIRAYVEKDDNYGDIQIDPKKIEIKPDDHRPSDTMSITNKADTDLHILVERTPESLVSAEPCELTIAPQQTGVLALVYSDTIPTGIGDYQYMILNCSGSDTVRTTVPIEIKR